MEEDRRSTPPSRIFLVDICSLQPDQHEVALFASTNYKTYIHVDIRTLELTQVKCLKERALAQTESVGHFYDLLGLHASSAETF